MNINIDLTEILITVGVFVFMTIWVVIAGIQQKLSGAPPGETPPEAPGQMPWETQPAPTRAREDLTDFLNELRRKSAAEEPIPALLIEEPSSPAPPPLPPPLPVTQTRPAPRADRPRPSQAKPPKLPPAVAMPVSAKAAAPSAVKSNTVAMVIAPIVTGRLVKSAVAGEVVQLLRSPTTLAAAILLREVLDAPRCRRRHGR